MAVGFSRWVMWRTGWMGWWRAEVLGGVVVGGAGGVMGGVGGGRCWCLGGWRWVPIDADDRTRYMNKIFN